MKYKFLAVWAIAAVLSGCYDDKGNYAYSEINEISIDTVGNQYTVMRRPEMLLPR